MDYLDEENYLEADDCHFNEDTGTWMSNQLVSVDLASLALSDNDRVFNVIKDLITTKHKFSLTCKINKDNYPYYEIDIPQTNSVKLYLNKDIILYMLEYFQKGQVGNANFGVFNADKNANEDYILQLIKRDHINGAARYNSKTEEYKAIYPYGTIVYGKLPYTTEEMKQKFNS